MTSIKRNRGKRIAFVPYFFMAVLLTVFSVAFAQPDGNTRSASNAGRVTGSADRTIDFFEVHAQDLRSVLRQLSAFSGVDIVASGDLDVRVSLSASNKSWREILDIICLAYDFLTIEKESFIVVKKKKKDEKQEDEALEPLVQEVISLRFARAAEIAEAVRTLLSDGSTKNVFSSNAEDGFGVTVRAAGVGKLTPIVHTNSLLIIDTKDNVARIKDIIKQIDIQTAQISISCKIIEVSSGVIQRMGVQWGYSDADKNVTLAQRGDGILDPMHGVTYGLLSPEKLGITLEYLFVDNKAEIVAQPQITTLDNKEAKVFMGQQIPVTSRDEGGNTVIQMIDAGTQLTVTPSVAGDGKIMLTLNPKRESFEYTGAGLPIINEQSALTNVFVNNGETVVIAGLTSNEQRTVESGIPILKSIPIIGNLFKKSSKTLDKRDLIIFVTPHIIHPGI
ncbi:MAG: type II and III secretion system protein [Chitinispirillales bacterium]|jgi:type IV pilus assembly protein PilQ|nr:type II and III secretion system protein [Chitinispirillales bacterium]